MKTKIKDAEKKFEPVTIEITLESEQDVLNLWHGTNLSLNDIKTLIKEDRGDPSEVTSNMQSVWDAVNEVAVKRGIKFIREYFDNE